MSVKRIYVEKKPAYAVQAQNLKSEIETFLGITAVTGVRILIRYDMEHISHATYEAAKGLIFSEPPVDDLYEDTFPRAEGVAVFSRRISARSVRPESRLRRTVCEDAGGR